MRTGRPVHRIKNRSEINKEIKNWNKNTRIDKINIGGII